MRAMPAPTLIRTAAIQPSTASPTSSVVSGRGGPARLDPSWTGGYQDWQAWARRYARQIGAVSFSAGVIADCCARCEIRVEEREPGSEEWQPSERPEFAGIMEGYANQLQSADELVRLHAYHYQVAGEMAQTQQDGNGGVEYGIYSWAAIELDKPQPGQAMVKVVPDGKVEKETAFALPKEQVLRFWIPDPEWQAFAWSPMVASIEDLHRYRALARYAWRTAESALAMNGLLWAPQGPFDQTPVDDDDDEGETGTPLRGLEQQYLDAARLRFSDTDDIAAIAPTLLHWDKEEGVPQHIKLSDGLDPQGIAFRQEALEDFARGSNLPVTTVIGGGVGDANHWSEWLASEKFFDSGVAPTMNRICWQDLTRSFLWPRAGASGLGMDSLRNLRIGYDPTPVIVHPDNSRKALDLYLSGLLAAAPTLESAGFEETEQMIDADERQWLLEVLAHGRLATQPAVQPGGPAVAPVDASTVAQGPPAQPTSPPTLSRVATVLLKALVSSNGHGPDD